MQAKLRGGALCFQFDRLFILLLTSRKYDTEKKTCKKFRLLKRLAEDELCVAEVMDLTFSNGTVDFVTLR